MKVCIKLFRLYIQLFVAVLGFQTFMCAPSAYAQTVTGAPQFSVDRGFFESSFSLALSVPGEPTAEIRYTVDGSAPSTTNGTVYTSPININTTTIVRAQATVAGQTPSSIVTKSYFFLADVIHQPANIPGYPNPIFDTGLGAFVPHDNEMDPSVVSNPAYSGEIINALKSIPTMSIAVNPADIFGVNGFYETDLEKPASVELIYPNEPEKNEVFSCGIRSHSHNRLKRSMRLLFQGKVRKQLLTSNIFRNGPLASPDATTQLERIILRAGNNRSWARIWNPDRTTYTEDEFYRSSHLAMGSLSAHGTFVHLYINGLYWGLFNPTERENDWFVATYEGGARTDYFSVSNDGIESGDPTRWNYLIGALTDKDMSISTNYNELKSYLDVQNFIDYMIVTWYIGMTDWPLNNFWGANRNTPVGPQRFYSWDGEWSWDTSLAYPGQVSGAWVHPLFRSAVATDSSAIGKIWHSARKNPEFMALFADRVYLHLFNNGALTDEKSLTRWDTLNNTIRSAVVAESARWGDALESLGQPTRTRDVDWLNEVTAIRNLINGNAARFLSALRVEGYYPNLNPPTFDHLEGDIILGDTLAISNPNPSGTIFYSLDGTDPRLPGGGTSPSAITYHSPLPISSSLNILARVRDGNSWSPLRQATFTAVSPPADISSALARPTFGLPEGSVVSGAQLTLGNSNASGTIYYTLTGLDPRANNGTIAPAAIPYSAPITITSLITVKARVRVGTVWSFPAQRSFSITAPPKGGAVTKLTLINADSDLPLPFNLVDGAILDLASLPTRRLNVRADASPALVGSVRFGYDATSNFRLENQAPYAFAGDISGNYQPWIPTLGSHQITATPFELINATGQQGTALSVQFTVTDSSVGSVNLAPVITLPSSLTVTLPAALNLAASVTDDGLPSGGALSFGWSKFSGPGTVVFSAPTALSTSASFSVPGSYAVRFSAGDGALTSTKDVPVTVLASVSTAAVTSLSLVNASASAANGQLIPGFENILPGSAIVVQLSKLPTRLLNIRANTNPSLVGSVRFSLDANGNFRTENVAPYALAGDTSGVYSPWTPTVGTHTVGATPFNAVNATGSAGAGLSVNFQVIE